MKERAGGFTLVELALVLTIVGLLIGGVLKGQQLIMSSRIKATLAQFKAVQAATTTFQDTYYALPGDLAGANRRIPGFVNRATKANISSLGDGIVGLPAWNLAVAQGRLAVANPATRTENETLFFWGQLAKANLLAGVNYNGSPLPANTAKMGETMPAAPIGGGFVVGYANGITAQRLSTAVAAGPYRILPSGLVLVLTRSPIATLSIANGGNVLTPNAAARMDRKLDDGNALAGAIEAYGRNTGATRCFLAAAPYAYNERRSSTNCGLLFRLQE